MAVVLDGLSRLWLSSTRSQKQLPVEGAFTRGDLREGCVPGYQQPRDCRDAAEGEDGASRQGRALAALNTDSPA